MELREIELGLKRERASASEVQWIVEKSLRLSRQMIKEGFK